MEAIIPKSVFLGVNMLVKNRPDDWYDKLYDELFYYEGNGGIFQLFKDRYQTTKQNDDIKFWRLFRCLYEQLEVVYPLMDIADILDEDYTPEIMYETMHKHEVKELNKLRNTALHGDEFIKLYRGQPFGDINGFSWTTDQNLAQWFATRTKTDLKPIVYIASIPREEIICYWNERKEKEVFMTPKFVLDYNIKLTKEEL